MTTIDDLPVEILNIIISQADHHVAGRFVCKKWKGFISMRSCGIKYSNKIAKRGNLKLLQWAEANECPLSKKICKKAAMSGNLEMIKWLRSLKCPWSKQVCVNAAKKGHLHIIKWARKYGCNWDGETVTLAARNGHLHVLQWADKHGCDFNERPFIQAAMKGHLHVLKWIFENYHPFDWSHCMELALHSQNWQIIEWLDEIKWLGLEHNRGSL